MPRTFRSFLLSLVLATLGASCVATPLPDPPSIDPSAMTLISVQPGRMRLEGRDGAIRGAVTRLRVTNPRTGDEGGRVETPVGAGGAFSVELAATEIDTLYLEQVEGEGDTFLGALFAGGDGVATTDAGPDGDGDGSPDAVDCAPSDGALRGRDCPPMPGTCATEADCIPGRTCTAGTCEAGPSCMPEVCFDAVDDDCNGVIDDCR